MTTQEVIQNFCLEAVKEQYPNSGTLYPLHPEYPETQPWPILTIELDSIKISFKKPWNATKHSTTKSILLNTEEYKELVIIQKEALTMLLWFIFKPQTTPQSFSSLPEMSMGITSTTKIEYSNPEYFELVKQAIKHPEQS